MEGIKNWDTEEADWDLKEAKLSLKHARERKDYVDVSDFVEEICEEVKNGSLTFTDIGTTKEELVLLAQDGYKSEAKINLELARDMKYQSSARLYIERMKKTSKFFVEFHDRGSFKRLLFAFFPLYQRFERRVYALSVWEYLAKAKISPSDIGTSEGELEILKS